MVPHIQSPLLNNGHRVRLLLVAIALQLATGCGDASRQDESSQPREMLFVDTKTLEPVIAPATTTYPALNPATKTRTLMPALYCHECEKWYPTPPVEEINRQPGAGSCPIHRIPLTPHGPWPGEGALREAGKGPA